MYHFISISEFKLQLQSGNAQSGSNWTIFFSCVTLQFDISSLKTKRHLFYATSSFVHHFVAVGEFILELQSGNAEFGSNTTIFRAVWPWNFVGWPWKTIGHLFNATSSFVHHLAAIGDFKLEIQSGNAQFGSKSTIFSRVTLQFDVWPWKTIRHLLYSTSYFVHHFVAIGVFRHELESGNAQFGSNSTIFRAVWPRKFDVWPWKTIGYPLYATSSFAHHFAAIGVFKLELESGNAQFGSNATIFRAVWPSDLTDDLKNQ